MARQRSRLHRFTAALLGAAAALLLRALAATWRVQFSGENPFATREPFVGALWHRGLFIAAALFRERQAVIPVSQSRDGDRIAAVLVRLGFGPPARGSSSRGGARALAGLIRALRHGHAVGVLCDGPRGPARIAKAGVLAVARASGAPLCPVGLWARPCLRFGSWDRVALPLPFARVACVFGARLRIPREARRDEVERLREELAGELDRLDERAEAALAGVPAALSARTGG